LENESKIILNFELLRGKDFSRNDYFKSDNLLIKYGDPKKRSAFTILRNIEKDRNLKDRINDAISDLDKRKSIIISLLEEVANTKFRCDEDIFSSYIEKKLNEIDNHQIVQKRNTNNEGKSSNTLF
jgi:hypothetical protein